MSKRAELAERIAERIRDLNLCTPYGGDVRFVEQPRHPHYDTSFSAPRNLDGTVSVYGTTFILVKYLTRYYFLPHHGSHIFTSGDHAIGFLEAIAQLDSERAQHFIDLSKK